MPIPVFGFLEYYNWNGKRIIPFVTSGGSGFGMSIEDMNDGEFLGYRVDTSEEEIAAWAKGILG